MSLARRSPLTLEQARRADALRAHGVWRSDADNGLLRIGAVLNWRTRCARLAQAELDIALEGICQPLIRPTWKGGAS
jgi:hypothetical protein